MTSQGGGGGRAEPDRSRHPAALRDSLGWCSRGSLHPQPSDSRPDLVLLHQTQAVGPLPAGGIGPSPHKAALPLQFLVHSLYQVSGPQSLMVALWEVQHRQQAVEVLLHVPHPFSCFLSPAPALPNPGKPDFALPTCFSEEPGKMMMASTVTTALSLVITSLGGTSMTCSRVSTLVKAGKKKGITKVRPGSQGGEWRPVDSAKSGTRRGAKSRRSD